MNDKERLEEIRNDGMIFRIFRNTTYLKDIEWLVAQTERVDELIKLVNYHQEKQKEAEDKNEPYRHQNKRYRELLKDVFNALENYLHVFTNESDLIESAEHLSKQIYDALESESE